MPKNRVEAFTDGVIAIIVTILVLELPRPTGTELSDLLIECEPIFVYLVSFIMLIIYWNNHHHILQLADHIDGRVLWMNNILLFFLSLFPFTTSWIGGSLYAFAPQFLFALIILLADLTWMYLLKCLARANEHDSHFSEILNDYKKMKSTILLNLVAILVSFILPIGAMVINLVMMLLWLIPDKKVEQKVIEKNN
ncbi:MAG: TMEM175 family protein [Streptococcaceae bacterium]|jgi:uncharacterized membrane protein|nr:TMEM175 family protein [Streptococcaceae bacterium]